MSEQPKYTPVQAIRRWMEEDIIARGICPPLVKLTKGFRNEDGQIDWERLSQDVVIQDATSYEPDSAELLTKVSADYVGFIRQAAKGTAPLALNIILPDFKTNLDYDAFLLGVKRNAHKTFTSTPQEEIFIKRTYRRITTQEGKSSEVIAGGVRTGPDYLARLVIDTAFNTIHFYGQRVGDEDLKDFPTTRGPIERYRMLSRAPHPLMQVLNVFRSLDMIGNLNRPMVHKRNTSLASGQNMDDYERTMDAFRQGKL